MKKFRRKRRKDSFPSQTLSGIVKKHVDGFGFLIPNLDTHEDVYLSRKQMQGLITDDEVEVEVFSRRGRFYGQVKKILKRHRTFVLGEFTRLSKKIGCLRDDQGFWGEDITFDLSSWEHLQEGAWVQVNITSYPGSKLGFRGRLIGVLGSFSGALLDNVRMLQQYNIPCLFSKKCLDESRPPPSHFHDEIFQSRHDLRSLPFVTIDSRSAKDFDDAIYVEKDQDGWILFVSIADVSFFVPEGSVLDKEASIRGNSTYFPNFVSPMLPENLSQNLCSLKPNEDRLTMTAQIHVDRLGNRKKFSFYESIICSHARLDYGQVQQMLDDPSAHNTSKKIQESIKQSWSLAQTLMNHRFKNGSLDFDIPQSEIQINAQGEVVDISKSQRLLSHRLVEECMLACNQSVAEFLGQKKQPLIYRVHEVPDAEDLSFLKKFLLSIDPNLNTKNPIQKKSDHQMSSLQHQISYWIQNMKGHPKELIMHNLILRSMKQACYSAYNKGHFGLSFSEYAHFTSPIRRYSDLVVHRILKKELGVLKFPSSSKKELEAKARILSQYEQRSVKAERRIYDVKKARFMKRFLGEEFRGMIVSIAKMGFFVNLKKYDVDGLVSLDSLGGRWLFDPVHLFLKADPSGYTFKQGDEVTVQVVQANIEEGQIDFDLIKHQNRPFQKQKRSKKNFKKKTKKLKKKRKRR